MTGAIHAYFLSQTHGLLEYERFVWLYTAFDGCHRVRATIAKENPLEVSHAKRIQKLCATYNIAIPAWADPTGVEQVAAVRNATIHEGLFFDEPLGFGTFGGTVLDKHVLGSMTALAGRVLIALLELPAHDYIQSPVTLRQMIGVRL